MTQPAFHLAPFRYHIDLFRLNSMSTPLAYALIPVDVGSLVSHRRFQTIADTGHQRSTVLASHYDLLTLRNPKVAAGQEDVAEELLIQVLRGKAAAVRVTLPLIVVTTTNPAPHAMPLHCFIDGGHFAAFRRPPWRLGRIL
jgi:hypothetical protein